MSTLVLSNDVRYYDSLGGTQYAAVSGNASNTITLKDSTNATTSAVTLTNVATPLVALDAVNKSYVDGLVVSGVTWKNAATAATVAGDMTASTYSAAGLGTITWVGVPTIDTVTLVLGNRVVVQNSAASGDTGGDSRGIYEVTTAAVNLVLTRTADAAAGSQANGAAIFVYDGSVNNDKAFVVTNDASVNWDGGVIFSIMSSVPAVVIGGADTQVQYNNSGALGADGSFTYNKTAATPVLAIGGAATGLTTFNLGTGAQASTIAGLGSGLLTLSSQGAFTTEAAVASNVSLFETTTSGTITLGNATAGTGTITIDGDSSIINVGPTTTGAINVGSSAAGALAVNNGGVMTVGANSTSMTIGSVANSTSTTLTGQTTNVGSATTTTTNVDGITVDVGSSVTTGLNLVATGVAGAVVITGGDATSSGTVSINTTTATTATVSGGTIGLTAGNGNTTGNGGIIDINAGVGGATGAGGAVTIDAGAGGATSGAGGAVTISAGDATAGNSNGGNISFLAGTKTGTGTNGNVILTTGGTNTASGVGTDTTNIISFNNTAGIVARMESDGRFYAPAFQTTSDATHKTNITRLSDPLERIKRVEGYSYNWKPEFSGYREQLEYGVTAQQLEEAGFENLVNGKRDGEKTVNYLGLIPFLIEAVKELSNKLENSENETKKFTELLYSERKMKLSRRE